MIGLVLAAAAAAAASQAADATPSWKFKQIGEDSNGSKYFQAEIVSDQYLVDANQRQQKAGFAVKCDANGLYLDIVWPETVAGDTYDGTKVDVRFKIDNGREHEAQLHRADMAAMALGKDGFRWLKDLSDARTLTVSVPDLYGGQTASFHIAGIHALYDRVRAQGCEAPSAPKKADDTHHGRHRHGDDSNSAAQ
jgi:hypothetical protein